MNIKNILNYFKTEEEIRQSMSLKEIVPILKQNLVDIKERDEVVIFKITKIKKSGFEVKVKGIFGFVPFSLMPWKYHLSMWTLMEKEIIEHKFFAKIAEIDLPLNRIILDATVTEFDKFHLVDGQTYKGLILKKAKKYVLVELGHQYHWNFGSQAFHVTLESPNDLEIDYYSISLGDEVELTYIQSANNWKKIDFGKVNLNAQPIETIAAFSQENLEMQTKLNNLQAKYEALSEKYTQLLKKMQLVETNKKDKKLIAKIAKLIDEHKMQSEAKKENPIDEA